MKQMTEYPFSMSHATVENQHDICGDDHIVIIMKEISPKSKDRCKEALTDAAGIKTAGICQTDLLLFRHLEVFRVGSTWQRAGSWE
jgi:hypothetical protein